jgi:hypothetical protein
MTVLNQGRQFWPASADAPHFEVPSGSGIDAIHRIVPWVGGLANGEFHFTGSYASGLFYPGLLNSEGHVRSNCADFDRMYKVTQEELDAFDVSGIPSEGITEWPSDLGAPVADGNGIPTDYEPSQGDRPAIVGREAAFFAGNDGGQDEVTHGGFPNVGMDVRVLAAALPSKPDVEVVYFRYALTLRNPVALEKAFIGFYVDPDVGDIQTDLVGSDTVRSTGFAYKRENTDAVYGPAPPAVGVTIVSGPLAEGDLMDNDGNGLVDEPGERLRMTSFVSGDDVHDGRPEYYYNHLQGLCGRSGKPIPYESNCLNPGTAGPTHFWYSGDPVTGTGWLDDRIPLDRVFLLSTGPFDWLPGEERVVEIAVIWARVADNLASAERVRSIGGYLAGSPDVFGTAIEEEGIEPGPGTQEVAVYPNPARENVNVSYLISKPSPVMITVFDVIGRAVRSTPAHFRSVGRYTEAVDLGSLPGGVYLLRVDAGDSASYGSLLVVH